MLFFAVLGQLDDEERICAEKIFCDHGKRIYALAHAIVKSRQDAEDVLDSVMISVMKNIGRFVGASDKSIRAQIYTYTRNEAINLYNKKKRASMNEVPMSVLEESGEDGEMSDSSFDTENIVIRDETVKIVRDSIRLLPDGYEDILLLYYLYGYDRSEIARVMHISENAVAVKLCRAKKKIVEIAGDKLYERTEQ